MMHKSILFQLGRWGIGGVEHVTVVVANELVRRGWSVVISAFEYNDRSLLEQVNPSVRILEFSDGWLSDLNRKILEKAIREMEVSIIVNQWCVPYKVTRFLKKAIRKLDVKLVSFHHTRPDINKRIAEIRNPFLKWLVTLASALNARMVYSRSNAYVVLSHSYVPLFEQFIHRRELVKLMVIPNPLTMVAESSCRKENIILYVGRLAETEKRVTRVLDVWRHIVESHPDWRLVILGDGPDKKKYEDMAVDLPRVEFLGFVNPARWYAQAKLMLLTSEFEGFPLVLVEAMASKCVPVALGSYPAVFDIIKEGCGRIVPEPFNLDEFSNSVESLMNDELKRKEMALCAAEFSNTFSIKAVVDRYEELFAKLGVPDRRE